MYTADMTLEEARDQEKYLLSIKPGGCTGPPGECDGYHGRAGIEQHRWDLEDVRGRIAELEVNA
jgi:hypothetical protein